MEGLPRASIRRYVEQEASAHFRPEVLARFTAVLVFGHLPREVQVSICRQMVEEEIAFQAGALSEKFGHPHRVRASPGLCHRLVGEGWHRRLGARPMRNVVERRIRGALVEAQLRGALCPGVRESVLCVDTAGGVRAGMARTPVVL
jgi:ATP-dependent Clp protease ATP-binding subunit ClpB